MACARVVVIFLVVCTSVGLSWASFVPSSGASGTSLYAVWSGFSGFTNITQVDPNTGQEGQVLYTSNEGMQLWPLSPAIDLRGQRLFVPFMGFFTGSVGVFDLSIRGKAVLQKDIPVLGNYIAAIQYDSVKNTVWLVSGYLSDQLSGFSLISVEMATGTVKNVSALPAGEIPAAGSIGGAPAIIDVKNRELIIATMKNPNTNHVEFSLVKFNLDSYHFTRLRLTGGIYPISMVNDRDTVYALFQPFARYGQVSFGTVDPATAKLNVINKWNTNTTTEIEYVMGSFAAYNATSSQFYSVLVAPPAAWTTVSTKTGQLEKAIYLAPAQVRPSGLFVF